MTKTQQQLDQKLKEITDTLDLNLLGYIVVPDWKPLSDHGTVYEYAIIIRDHDRQSIGDVYGLDWRSLATARAMCEEDADSFVMWDWYNESVVVVFNTWSENE